MYFISILPISFFFFYYVSYVCIYFIDFSRNYDIHTFSGGSVVKNSPANAGDTGLIPGSGILPEKEMVTHSSILAWEIPRTEKPGGPHTVHEVTEVRHDSKTKTTTIEFNILSFQVKD